MHVHVFFLSKVYRIFKHEFKHVLKVAYIRKISTRFMVTFVQARSTCKVLLVVVVVLLVMIDLARRSLSETNSYYKIHKLKMYTYIRFFLPVALSVRVLHQHRHTKTNFSICRRCIMIKKVIDVYVPCQIPFIYWDSDMKANKISSSWLKEKKTLLFNESNEKNHCQ